MRGGGGLSKIEFADGGMTHIAACEEVDAEMAGMSKEKEKKEWNKNAALVLLSLSDFGILWV